MELPFIRDALLRTAAPDGKVIRLPPPAVETEFLKAQGGNLPFAPAYGEHTDALLTEAGLSDVEIRSLHARGVIAG